MTENEYIIEVLGTIQNNLDKENEKSITNADNNNKDLPNRNGFNAFNGVKNETK